MRKKCLASFARRFRKKQASKPGASFCLNIKAAQLENTGLPDLFCNNVPKQEKYTKYQKMYTKVYQMAVKHIEWT
jgi:hypothetical protein